MISREWANDCLPYNKLLINLPKELFYIIKKEYLCAMFLQRVHKAPLQSKPCRKSQQQMLGSVCE